ncbi:hypothetical protein VTH06DRAFT_1263 [Thermothelomyces fergusii]
MYVRSFEIYILNCFVEDRLLGGATPSQFHRMLSMMRRFRRRLRKRQKGCLYMCMDRMGTPGEIAHGKHL